MDRRVFVRLQVALPYYRVGEVCRSPLLIFLYLSAVRSCLFRPLLPPVVMPGEAARRKLLNPGTPHQSEPARQGTE